MFAIFLRLLQVMLQRLLHLLHVIATRLTVGYVAVCAIRCCSEVFIVFVDVEGFLLLLLYLLIFVIVVSIVHALIVVGIYIYRFYC